MKGWAVERCMDVGETVLRLESQLTASVLPEVKPSKNPIKRRIGFCIFFLKYCFEKNY